MKFATAIIAGSLTVLLSTTCANLTRDVQRVDRVALLDVIAVDALGLPTRRYSAVFRFQILSAVHVAPAFESRLRGETILCLKFYQGADVDNVDGRDAITRLSSFLKARAESGYNADLEHVYVIGDTRPLRIEVLRATDSTPEVWTLKNADGDTVVLHAPVFWGSGV